MTVERWSNPRDIFGAVLVTPSQEASCHYLKNHSITPPKSIPIKFTEVVLPTSKAIAIPNPKKLYDTQIEDYYDLSPQEVLEKYFSELVNQVQNQNKKRELQGFLEEFPLGFNVHEHSGCHKEDMLDYAISANKFWDTVALEFKKVENPNCVPASALKLKVNENLLHAYYAKVTQPKISAFGKSRSAAMAHFHGTFLTTESAEIPLYFRLIGEYKYARLDKLQGVQLMVDLGEKSKPPEDALKALHNLGDAWDNICKEEVEQRKSPGSALEFFESQLHDTLEDFAAKIDSWAADEAYLWQEELSHQGKFAQSFLKLEGDIFGDENPIKLTLQAEIGKAHSLDSQNSATGKLLARFACDIVRAMKLEQNWHGVTALNFVGPEHHVVHLEPLQLRIIKFFHDRYKGKIAYHAGELCPEISDAKHMLDRVGPIVDLCEPVRIGHGTCFVGSDLERLSGDKFLSEGSEQSSPPAKALLPIEAGPTAAKRLLGVEHPTDRFTDKNIPVIMITDNRNVFQISLAKQFYFFIKKWTGEGVSYIRFKTITRDSIHFSDIPGESIFNRVNGVHLLKERYAAFLKMPDFETNAGFKSLDSKAKYQIRHERAIEEFENQLLVKIRTGKRLSISPPKLPSPPNQYVPQCGGNDWYHLINRV